MEWLLPELLQGISGLAALLPLAVEVLAGLAETRLNHGLPDIRWAVLPVRSGAFLHIVSVAELGS